MDKRHRTHQQQVYSSMGVHNLKLSLFPGFPAFSFGLPCIALLAGGYPYLKFQPVALLNTYWITAAGLCAAVAVMAALIIRKRKELDYA
jgi:LPXTG-motif cell wall-anchored protein